MCKSLSPEVGGGGVEGKGLVQDLQGDRVLSDRVLDGEWVHPRARQRQKWPVWRMLWIGVGIYTNLKLPTGKPESRAGRVLGVVGGAGIMALVLPSLCLCLICRWE